MLLILEQRQYLIVVVQHRKVSNAENEFMQKIFLGVVMTVPEQVAADVSELERHGLLSQ